MTVLGTRPEIIRLSEVIKKIDKFFNHTLVHTGQNYDYELNEIFFRDLGLKKPNIFLEVSTNSALESIGQIISKIEKHIDKVKPDAFLVLGDTNSCLAALAAKRKKIPIFHMEAGNRCFDQRVPEETNRKIVDHIADVNLTYSDIAREYLLREGFPSDRIIRTGSPISEVLKAHITKIQNSKILQDLNLAKYSYFLVSLHREENVDGENSIKEIGRMLNALSSSFNLPVMVSLHPRTSKSLKKYKIRLNKNIILHKPFGFIDYVALQISSKATLSDSGTINEESSILNFPALNLRNAHERPEGMEEGAVMMTGIGKDRVLQGLEILNSQKRGLERTIHPVKDYSYENVSEKIPRIILSYVNYINSNVWKK
ncbi:UDP-N-acetylglucosamine 2-epimerase (non-hydrolyzing) [Gammaproteobacteria bacterium]|nr:UDP-N-acetylglucosamine 2-epimerase (non-hydrolyzing) [Gammaproteobacteria bacterium]